VPDVYQRFQEDPPARVADVACGTGWSSIALARAYPKIHIDGFDSDQASIELAHTNVEREGLGDRVSFHVKDASEVSQGDRYDLVTVFEAIHDMARPVEALKMMRHLLAPGGSAIVADERTAEGSARREMTQSDCSTPGASSSASRPEGRINPPRQPAPSCGPTRSASTRRAPVTEASRSCLSRTTSGASIGSCREPRRLLMTTLPSFCPVTTCP
jgi:trans-aconitate methyltransferase